MTVLIPVAIPTSDCGTASTIRFAIAANANVIPEPSRMPAAASSHGMVVGEGRDQERQRRQHGAGREQRAEADALARWAASGPAANCASAVGISSSPACVTVKPNP